MTAATFIVARAFHQRRRSASCTVETYCRIQSM